MASGLCFLIPIMGILLKKSKTDVVYETYLLTIFHSAPAPVVTISSALALVFSPVVCVLAISVITLVMRKRGSSWRFVLSRVLTSGLPLIYIFLVKIVVNRPRPVIPGVVKPADPSFPSGHVAAAICVLSLILLGSRRLFRNMFAWCGVGLIAACVALSRLVLGVHFVSDVAVSLLVCPLLIAALKPVTERMVGA